MSNCPCGKPIGDKYIVCYPCMMGVVCPLCKGDKETNKPICLKCWKKGKQCVKCNGSGYEYLMEDLYGPCDCPASLGKKDFFCD